MEQEVPENLALEIESEALAYVLYSSASTGKPRGAQISHRVLANFLQSMQRELGAAGVGLSGTGTRVFQPAGANRGEVQCPFISGGSLALSDWGSGALPVRWKH